MATKKTITTIPAIKPIFASQTTETGRKRRAAAYARVSTDSDEQFTSFEAQVDYYTRYISEHPDWEFVKVYADEGISGTSTKHRAGFQEMIRDALDGKIDIIVTKSISRFARNTIDTLTTVRQLKEKGIEVFFEKENIYTLDSKGELLITIMSSIAQEESRSISENVTWGQRKRFADGKVSLPYKNFLGYRRGPDGVPEIVEKEENIVRYIYRLCLEGKTPHNIAKIITEEGIPTPSGKTRWQQTTVESILTNEKYKGDALLQKKYTVDFLSKKQKVNEGEIPQYYVEGSHEAIVSAEVFDLVQYELQRRRELKRVYSSMSIFSSRIICGECGGIYGAKTWHSTDSYRKEVYFCNHKYGKKRGEGKFCGTPTLTEAEIKAAFVGAFNSCIKNRTEIIENCRQAIATLFATEKLETEVETLTEECSVVSELIRRCVDENAHIAVDPQLYAEKYDGLAERYTNAKERLDAVTAEIAKRNSRKEQIEDFLRTMEKAKTLVIDFDEEMWNAVIESLTVYSKERLVFTFKSGTQVEWSIK